MAQPELDGYRFTPQPDITAYELARIMAGMAAGTLNGIVYFSPDAFDALGASKRHLTRTMPEKTDIPRHHPVRGEKDL